MSDDNRSITRRDVMLIACTGLLTTVINTLVAGVPIALGIMGHFVWHLGWFPIVVIILAWLASLVGVAYLVFRLFVSGIVSIFQGIGSILMDMAKARKAAEAKASGASKKELHT